jgi:hypothetical protein
MKKLITVIIVNLLLLLHGKNVQAQIPDYDWIKFANNPTSNTGLSDLHTDSVGNSYILGNFEQWASFDSITITNNGSNRDIFIAKLNPQGNFVWAKNYPIPNSSEVPVKFDFDNQGNIYLISSFTGDSIVIDTNVFYKYPNKTNYFVTKIDTLGNFSWAQHIIYNSNFGCHITGFKLDSQNNLTLVGYGSGSLQVAGYPYTCNNSFNKGFVLRFDADGHFTWSKCIASNFEVKIHDLYIDTAGNSIISGTVVGNLILDTIVLNTNLLYQYNIDGFVARLNPAGNFVWGKNYESAYAIQTQYDANKNSYLAGSLIGPQNFGSIAIQPGPSASSDVFIAKFDSLGICSWANVYGNSSWTESILNFEVDDEGNILICGDFHGTIAVGPFSLVSNGIDDYYVIKLDKNGNVIWAKSFGSMNSEYLSGFKLDCFGNGIFIGINSSTMYFDSIAIPYSSAHRCYIAKIGNSNTYYVAPTTLIYPPNQAINIPNNFSFDWSSVPYANWYIIEYDDSINFNNPEVDSTSISEFNVPNNLIDGTTYYWRVKCYNTQSNSSTWSPIYTFQVNFATAENNNFYNKPVIYPNPTEDGIYINLAESDDVQIEITDLSGRIVLNEKVLQQSNIYLPLNLAQGMYQLRIIGSHNNSVSKLMVK